MKIRNIVGINRFFILDRIKREIFFHYLGVLFKKKIDFKQFRLLIRRVRFMLKSFKLNKVYKIGHNIKLDQLVPFWKTEAFYNYTDRFLNFESKLDCSTVVLSISKDCSFSCKHCYQKHDTGEDISLEALIDVTKAIKKVGVTNFIIEGGDPFINFDRLKEVCITIGFDAEITINSTGNGITLERLKELQSCSNLQTITLSMNSPNIEDVNFFMSQDYAWNTINHGLKLCKIASVATSLNCCLNNEHYTNGNFEYLMEIAKGYGVAHVRLIHPKAAGAWLQGSFPHFKEEDILHIKGLVKKYNKSRKYRKHPAITAQVVEEDAEHYGCAAGGTDRFYVNAKGDVQPCEFLNISFGNIIKENFVSIYKGMREVFKTPGNNWLCEMHSDYIFNKFSLTKVLPIEAEEAKKLYEKWDLGTPTSLYNKLEKELL